MMIARRNTEPHPSKFREDMVRLALGSELRSRGIAGEFEFPVDPVRRWVKQRIWTHGGARTASVRPTTT